MKITKLLAATSILAMTATSAHALDIVNGTNVGSPGFLNPLANELCLGDGGDAVAGTLRHTITLTSGGNFPQNLRIDVTLPSGVTFNGASTGGDVTARGTATDASLQTGGADGDSTAQYILSETNASGTGIYFDLNVEVSDCPDGSGIEFVVFDTQNNLFVEGDAVVNSNEVDTPMTMVPTALPGCADGITGELLADDPEKEIILGAFDTIADNVVGTFEYTINPNVSTTAGNSPITNADISGVDWTVTVEDGDSLSFATNVTTGNVSSAFGTGVTASENNDTFASGVVNEIAINENGRDPIPNQSVMFEAEVDFTTASGLRDKESDTAMFDPLNRDGRNFGRFDWVGSGNGAGTVTVFRVTGLDTEDPTPYTVELSNTPNGTYDGVYNGVVAGGNDGEITLVSTNLFGVDSPVDFVRGDVTICFETNNTRVDVDRLLLRNGIVSAFNDGANATDLQSDILVPSADFDN